MSSMREEGDPMYEQVAFFFVFFGVFLGVFFCGFLWFFVVFCG